MITLGLVIAFNLIGDVDFSYEILFPYAELIHKYNIIITEQNIHTWSAVVYFVSYAPWVLGASIIWLFISWNFGDKMMIWSADAKPISLKDNPQIYRLVENVAIAAGLPRPNLYIINDDSLNAFATGKNPANASIILTTGIIAKLEPLELEGVIAHEMAHIGNRDIRLNMLIITGLSIFTFLADVLYYRMRTMPKNKNDGKFVTICLIIYVALLLFNLFIAPLIQFAISRSREYAADATGALITRNPLALAKALEKISSDSRVEILDSQKKMATACIANPHAPKVALSSVLATHPPIKKRISRLIEMS